MQGDYRWGSLREIAMRQYVIVWKCAKGIARQIEHTWHEHPEIEQAIDIVQKTRDGLDYFHQLEGIYQRWTDQNGQTQHTRVR
jgi:hypothetical protein